MKFILPNLPYQYNALEKFIDEETMIIHHTKHHQGYVDNLNKVINDYPFLDGLRLEELIIKKDIPLDALVRIKNYGGGHYNHSLFWEMMSPEKIEIDKITLSLFDIYSVSIETVKKDFLNKGAFHFGSGWCWLVYDTNKLIMTTVTLPNQDSPLFYNLIPILGIDLWEHSYYLKYKNRRDEYISNWFNLINWNFVKKQLELIPL